MKFPTLRVGESFSVASQYFKRVLVRVSKIGGAMIPTRRQASCIAERELARIALIPTPFPIGVNVL